MDQIITPLRQVCAIAAVAIGALALVKLTGLVSVRFSVMDLAAVGILCAIVGSGHATK